MADTKSDKPAQRFEASYWRSAGGDWLPRLLALAVGVALAFVPLRWVYVNRIDPTNLALGVENWATVVEFQGRRLNAWSPAEYPTVYAAGSGETSGPEALWLGNSQVHAVNQKSEGDKVAPYYASGGLGYPVYALTLPNANLQEHRVVTEWALARRRPGWLILPLVCDDLREEGLRGELDSLASPELLLRLRSRPVGARLADELAALGATQTDAQGTTRARAGGRDHPYTLREVLHGLSLQDVCEERLERIVGDAWAMWKRRPEMYSTVVYRLYLLRNAVFHISARSKRPMIALRYERNMDAYRETIRVARGAGVRVLAYIAPLRNDAEPPYRLDEYAQFKMDAARIAAEEGAEFVDLEGIVPPELWGEYNTDDIDFMHFRGAGHRILGERVGAEIARRSGAAPASSGAGAGGGR